MTIKINGDNTVANPGFSGDDTDTGLQVGTNELKLVTGGTEAVTVDSSQNVGIGLSNPGYPLDVVGNIRFGSNTGYALLQYGTDSTGTDNWHVGSEGDGSFRFYNGVLGAGSEKMRIDVNGKVGIGTTSPGHKLEVNGDVQIGSYSDLGDSGLYVSGQGSDNSRAINIMSVDGNGGGVIGTTGDSGADNGLVFQAYRGGGTLRFQTGGSNERMRISSVGHIHIHSTTNFPGAGNTTTGAMLEKASDGTTLFVSRNGGLAGYFNRNSNGELVRFLRSGSGVGSVQVTSSSTSYNTSSDYRLKENVVSISDGITRVKQLQPKRFNFIVEADRTVDGFLAHEAQAVVPESVTGTHNEVDDEGNAVMQGIDQSKLVPLLTAALQEAIAKIETLETQNADLFARVTTLENA